MHGFAAWNTIKILFGEFEGCEEMGGICRGGCLERKEGGECGGREGVGDWDGRFLC